MTAADHDAAMRAAFHEVARLRFGEMGVLNLNGVYAGQEVNTAWWAWQEATRRAQLDIADTLEGVADEAEQSRNTGVVDTDTLRWAAMMIRMGDEQ